MFMRSAIKAKSVSVHCRATTACFIHLPQPVHGMYLDLPLRQLAKTD
jgi:hypothetical protein